MEEAKSMSKIKNLKIRTRLLIAFMFVAIIMIGTFTIAVVDVNNTIAISDEVVEKVIDPLDWLLHARVLLESMKIDGRDILIETNAQKQGERLTETLAKLPKIRENMQAYYETIDPSWDDCFRIYGEITEQLDIYEANMKVFQTKIIRGDEDAGAYLTTNLSPISDKSLDLMAQLNGVRLDVGRNFIKDSNDSSRVALTWLIVCSVIGLALTVVSGIYLSISISNPILKCVDIMTKAGNGDFTVRLPSDYAAETGQLFASCNMLIEFSYTSVTNLWPVINKMRDAAQKMLDISTDMAVNSKELNNQTSTVSTATEEFSAGMTQSADSLSTASTHISAVASSIEEINSTISTVAAAAEETSTRVVQSSALVESIQGSIVKTSGSVKLVSDTFNSVAENVEEINKSILVVSEHSISAKNKMSNANEKATNTNEIIRRLEAASKQIGKIVSVINDIADQTNMLALNAAIEAAGAGEAGKGFMVVANEVKELAKQTADATDEIAAQIENMQKNVPEAVGAVSEITTFINGMTEFINSFAQEMGQQEKRSNLITEESTAAARRMNEIADEINSISENAQSVTKTVLDSTKGVNEIAKSTAELVVGTQEIAMNSERASNNINEINRAAKEMASGLVDISKNIQLINEESGKAQHSADSAKQSSEELIATANEMETFMKQFKVS